MPNVFRAAGLAVVSCALLYAAGTARSGMLKPDAERPAAPATTVPSTTAVPTTTAPETTTSTVATITAPTTIATTVVNHSDARDDWQRFKDDPRFAETFNYLLGVPWQMFAIQLAILGAFIGVAGVFVYTQVRTRLEHHLDVFIAQRAKAEAHAMTAQLMTNVAYHTWQTAVALGETTDHGRAHVELAIDLLDEALANARKLAGDDERRPETLLIAEESQAYHLATRASLQPDKADPGDIARALEWSRAAYDQRTDLPRYANEVEDTFIYVRYRLYRSGLLPEETKERELSDARRALERAESHSRGLMENYKELFE